MADGRMDTARGARRRGALTRGNLLRSLVAHLRRERTALRRDWIRRIQATELLTAMSLREIYNETKSVYDNYLEVLETGSVVALKAYAENLSARIILRGVETHEVLGIVLLLRDVLARSLFKKYHHDFELLERVLDVYEPAANRIANTVGVSFVEARERVIRLQQQSMRTFHVQEEERKRISRELHDEVGQALTAINVQLAVLQRDSTAEMTALLSRKIADIGGLLVGAMTTVHAFARELRPTMLDDLGLVPALRSYVRSYTQRTGLPVRFSGSIDGQPLDAEQRTALFRVVQECLTNVARHAEASRVTVTLRAGGDTVRMRIRDNGRGFEVAARRSDKRKRPLGLLGMEERVRLVNGRLLVRSSPGRGTTVEAEIPFRKGSNGTG